MAGPGHMEGLRNCRTHKLRLLAIRQNLMISSDQCKTNLIEFGCRKTPKGFTTPNMKKKSNASYTKPPASRSKWP